MQQITHSKLEQILERMYEGEDVRILVLQDQDEKPIAWVFTNRLAILNGVAYRVSHGYGQLPNGDVDYEYTMYDPYIASNSQTGTILHSDPAPHPERNKA
jgi:hypothetical protein